MSRKQASKPPGEPAPPEIFMVSVGSAMSFVPYATEVIAANAAITCARQYPGQKILVVRVLRGYQTSRPNVEPFAVTELVA